MWWSLQARVAVRRGRHDLAGEGRVAGEQRTTPSSPCAIQLIASRGVSLSAFSCAGPPSSGRTAYGRPAQCTCPPPFAASRPHLRNRGEAIGRSRSTAAAVASEEIVGARSVTKCGGRKSYDQRGKSRSKYFIFFGHFSRRCQLRTSRKCSKVNSRYVVATFHSSIHPRPPPIVPAAQDRRVGDATVNGGSLACPPLCAVIC